MKINSKLTALAAAAFAAVLTACGGGGGGDSSTGTQTGGTSDGGTAGTGSTTPTAASLVTTVPAPTYGDSALGLEKAAVFNQLNEDRARCGFGMLAQNSKLDSAAQAHADYLTLNGYSEHHSETAGKAGFTGATAADRLTAATYSFAYYTENIGPGLYGTFFSESGGVVPYSGTQVSGRNVLRTLYSSVYHLAGLMSGDRDIGLGISTRDNSTAGGGQTAFTKTLTVDAAVPTGMSRQTIAGDSVSTFPCEGTAKLNPNFLTESPNPFPEATSRDVAPYGQPIYVRSAQGTTLKLVSATVTRADQTPGTIPARVLSADNDPNKLLGTNEVFVVPTQPLASNATYEVTISGSNSGMVSSGNATGTFMRRFMFSTGTFTSD